MSAHAFHQQLDDRLAKAREAETQHVLTGKCETFEDYKARTARIRTLDDIAEAAQQIARDIYAPQEERR